MTESLELERKLTLAPKDCFALWSDPSELQWWWGPKNERGEPFRAEIVQWRVEEGATWAINMFSPEGSVYRQGGEMIEVVFPRLIRFSFHWIEGGRRGPRTEISVSFDPEGEGTRMRFRQSGFANAEVRNGHSEGWHECLDRFEAAARRESEAT